MGEKLNTAFFISAIINTQSSVSFKDQLEFVLSRQISGTFYVEFYGWEKQMLYMLVEGRDEVSIEKPVKRLLETFSNLFKAQVKMVV